MRSFSKLKFLKRFFSLLIIEQEELYISSANIQFLLFWLLLSNLLFTEIIFAIDLQRDNLETIRQIKQNLFPFKIKSLVLSINQILLLLVLKISIVILMIRFYKKNLQKNDFFNDQYQKGFFYFTKKLLFLGGYQILTIPSFLFCMEREDKFYAWAFYYCDRFFSLILILYSFMVYFIGISEFGKSQERSKSSRVLFFLMLKFWLTVFYLKYKFMYKGQQKNDVFCFIQCMLCFVIIKKLQKNPFLNLKTNITTYYVVSIISFYQVVFFFLSKFQVNQQQNNIRVKLLITIPFIVKFLNLCKNKFWKIDKQEFLEYCFQNDLRQVLKISNKQKINFDIINYMKNHFMECVNPSCTCSMKNPINISRKNHKQQYPNQLKSPCLYIQLAQEILIQDIKKSNNFQERYFYHSRLCLYYGKYDNLFFFRSIKQEFDSQFFYAYFCKKVIQYASQSIKKTEIIYNKNDLKYIKPQSIQKFKTYEEQVMQNIQNFLQTLKLFIYESQARTYRIPKIKLLNEKLYQIINEYVNIYSKTQSSLKLKKLHNLFFDNFILVKQPCFKKIYRNSSKRLQNYQTQNLQAQSMCQQEKWQFFVLDFSYQDLAVIRQTSNNIKTFLGYEKSELIDQSINKIICQELGQTHDNYMMKFLKTGIKTFTLNSHQVFLEHKKGYTEQIHLQQKFFILQKNKSLQNFTLMKRLAYDRQIYIIANKQGQILNYTEQFLKQYPGFKNQDEKINICQIIPNSVRWLILLNQKNLSKMNSEQINVWLFNQMGMQNKFPKILDWIFFNKKEKFGQEKNEIFHHFFNKCLQAPQSVNKEKIVQKVQAKTQLFQVCFYSKQQILYKLSFLNIQNYFRTIIQIVDQKENPTNNLFTKSKLLDFFEKIVLIKIYLEKWQKLKNKKKQNLFGLRQFDDNQNKTETPKLNQKNYLCYQEKNNDTNLQLQTKQYAHSRTILNIVKNKHSSIYLKFYIFVIIVYFCAPIIVILGTQQQNSGVFSQSVLDFKNHQAETEILNKLKIYKLLKTNFPEYKIISNTIENQVLEQLKIYFNGLLSKKRQNKLFQQNFVQNLSAECYEIILQQFYITQNTILYQNMDFNQIIINCKDKNHEKNQKHKTSKYSLYFLLLGFEIQLVCALGLIIIEFLISKFMNQVYKFPVYIIKPQNYLNKIDAFFNHLNIQIQYQQQNFNKNQSFKAKHFVYIKLKKLSILLLVIISAITVSLKIYLYGSVYQEFYTQINKIKITKEAHNSRFSELFLISNDRSKNTTNQKLKKYKNFEVPHITFFQYFDNNEQFQNQLIKEIYDILYSYQVFQTMKDLNFMMKDSKYYFVLLDFFLRNFLSKKNKPIFETRWLLNYQVYNMISQDLFDRYSKMMINPFEQKLKVFSNKVLITTIILNIFLFIFLCECCLKKKQQEIEMSLYVFRFVNTKKLKQNKVFMNFIQKLKAEEQIIICLINVIYQNFQIVHSNGFHKKIYYSVKSKSVFIRLFYKKCKQKTYSRENLVLGIFLVCISQYDQFFYFYQQNIPKLIIMKNQKFIPKQFVSNFYTKTMDLQEDLSISFLELKILSTIAIFMSLNFIEQFSQNTHNFGGSTYAQYKWINLKKFSMLYLDTNQIQQYIILLLQIIFLYFILNYYLTQNRVKNIGHLQYITCKFIKYFNKFLFIGGYWIFILILLYQKNHEIQSYLQQIVLILNIIASIIILLYSFFVTYIGLPEFRKYSQKSFQTSFFFMFQLKSLLPFCFYVFLSFSPIKEILFIIMNICLQYFIYKQIIKKPFFEEKANRLFFCVTFLQTLFQFVLCLHKVFFEKQFALYNRPLYIILIPILIKLLILFYQKYTKISKKQIFEYFNTNDIKHTLDRQINKPFILQIISFGKNHIQSCHKIECLCKSINYIKNAQNNTIQKYPIELKCPLLYGTLLKHLAVNEYLASKNFDDIWFFCSRIGLFFFLKQRAIDQCKYFMHQYQNFRDLYNKAKFYYFIQIISQNFEKKILKNDIKKIDVHKIINNEKLIIQLKIQIQKYIEIYNQLIYQSQKQIIDICVIKQLNEQIYEQYKSYYEIYIKVRKNKKIQKLHELFFENFVLIQQKNILKIRLNDNTFFQQEYTRYNFQDNTYYITVGVSAQNLGIINQTSSNIEDCFGIVKKNIIGQSINVTFEEKYWKQHDQYLQRYVNDSLRNFSLSKHQVFFKHQQGYAFQCSLQQKAYFCTRNNEFMFFVLLRQQNIQQQVILIDELGYITNYTRSFLSKFPIAKEAQKNQKINILQLIPQSIEWLIDTFLQIKKTMLQQAQNQMFTQQLKKSDGNRSYVHSMVFNDINYKKEQYIDFKGFFDKIMQKIQENDKEEIKKKILTKMSCQNKFFVQKYLILYDIKTKTANNLHITQISIKDKREINLRKAITSNKVFKLFYKITVLRLFVLKWQKLRRLKQVKFFKIQLSLQQGSKEGKNLTKLYVTNSKHGTKELKTADQNQIQISERQNQDQSILKDILEKNRYTIEFRFLMLFTILLFCTVPVFYIYIYYKDDKTIKNLIKIQQQDLLKLQLQNYLQISLFLQKNYTFFDTIRQTIKEKILKQFEIFFKSYIDKKNLTSLQIKSTLQKSIKANQLEFFASIYTQTIYYERYQIKKIHQNLDQLLEISELKQDNVFEAVFLQIKLQYFSLLLCVCIQTLLVFTLCFITKKVNQFINKIYMFSTLIQKDKKQFQAVQNFCRLNQLEVQNIDLLKNGHENNIRLTKYKNFKISYIPLIFVVILLYLLSFCYFLNQYRQCDNLLSEVQKIQSSKKNLLEASTKILQIYKNDEFESQEQLQELIEDYNLTIQTFNNYMDNNDDFYQSVSRFKIPVVLKYQIRQTMRSTVYFQRKYRYIYNINEIMLKNYLNLDLNQKTEQFLTLEQLVYLLVMRDLFYDNIDIIIKPVQQKLQQSFMRLSLWLNLINIIVLILFWVKFVNKIKKQINISFYIMKFIDKQKFYTNSQLKLFASKLSSY